jgi:nicotinamidase-related amidase
MRKSRAGCAGRSGRSFGWHGSISAGTAGPTRMESLPRSPELMSADDTGLLVVDVQDKLIGLIPAHERIVWNIRRLIDGAKILNLPVVATEQYPKGLGSTVGDLAERLARPIPDKLTFSCGGCPSAVEEFRRNGRHKILVVGIETHVCVAQTVMDLLAEGYRIYVAADAVGARGQIDHEIALRRMEISGATLTTTEAVLFEWCEVAGTQEFKQISGLVREKMG